MSDDLCGHLQTRKAAMVLVSVRLWQSIQSARSSLSNVRSFMKGGTVSDTRVAFDFTVQRSNGGGLQGQGFRLDIDVETISDDDPAAYLITDPPLLTICKHV